MKIHYWHHLLLDQILQSFKHLWKFSESTGYTEVDIKGLRSSGSCEGILSGQELSGTVVGPSRKPILVEVSSRLLALVDGSTITNSFPVVGNLSEISLPSFSLFTASVLRLSFLNLNHKVFGCQ